MLVNNILKITKKNDKISIPVLEVHIVDHCNLKCKACSHFSNIAEEYYITPEELSMSLDLVNRHFKVYSFALMGGEPLLHPNLEELVYVARKKLPNSKIVITTNGLLIKSISEKLWNALKDNNITINVSKYPVNSSEISEILDIIDERDLLGRVYVKNKFRKYINLKGTSNRHLTFQHCYVKHCLTVKGDKLYKCPFSLYVKYFNKKFNAQIAVSEGINLREANKKQIEDFLQNPIQTCEYCSFARDDIAWDKWGRTGNTPQEWCID